MLLGPWVSFLSVASISQLVDLRLLAGRAATVYGDLAWPAVNSQRGEVVKLAQAKPLQALGEKRRTQLSPPPFSALLASSKPGFADVELLAVVPRVSSRAITQMPAQVR